MFGIGNKKRIEFLEDRTELMSRVIGERLGVIEGELRSIRAILRESRIDGEAVEKCFNCRIMTSEKIVKPTSTRRSSSVTTNYIPTKEAIERIMDHLGIEFDHIDAKQSETVIKTKEATKPCPENQSE